MGAPLYDTFVVFLQRPDLRFALAPGREVLADMQWMALDQLPERDRAHLWAAGLMGVPEFFAEVDRWGNAISYP